MTTCQCDCPSHRRRAASTDRTYSVDDARRAADTRWANDPRALGKHVRQVVRRAGVLTPAQVAEIRAALDRADRQEETPAVSVAS